MLGFPELKDKLLLYQAGASVQDPLRVYGVSDNSMESALQAVGAVEVGQASQGRRLFAMECAGDRNDQVWYVASFPPTEANVLLISSSIAVSC